MIRKRISQAEVFEIIEKNKDLSQAHKYRHDLPYVTKEANLCCLFFKKCGFSSGKTNNEIESGIIRELIKRGYPFRFSGFDDVYNQTGARVSVLAFGVALEHAKIPYKVSPASPTVFSLPMPREILVIDAIIQRREGRLD